MQAISQRTSCSQSCVPGATKAFLFELSENSSSCPFTQEQSEPPVAIVVKVFSSHRSPASSKEPQSPHSGIVPSVTHSSHRTHSTDFKSGPFLRQTHGPSSPHKCARSWYETLALNWIQLLLDVHPVWSCFLICSTSCYTKNLLHHHWLDKAVSQNFLSQWS